MKIFFKKTGVRLKIILTVIAGILGLFFFLFVRGKIRARDKLEYELQRVRYEMELLSLEKKTSASDQKAEELKQKEKNIKEKIRLVEEREVHGEELSVDELEDFFKDRGF